MINNRFLAVEKDRFFDLKKFLREKGVYDIFYYNFKHKAPTGSDLWEEDRENIFFHPWRRYTIATYLLYCFDWSKTTQGHIFWHKLFQEAESFGRCEEP